MREFIVLLSLMIASFSYAQEGYVKPSNQRIETFNSREGFYQNTIFAITSDAKGYLWIATPNGLVRYDGYSFEYYYHDEEDFKSLPNNYISNLLSDSKGRLWVGTNNGLCIYLIDQEQFMPLEAAFKNVTFIKEDDQKRVWTGSGSKLIVYDVGSNDLEEVSKLIEINLETTLDGNDITDIEFLSDSELLVSTAGDIVKVSIDESNDYSVEVSKLKFESNITKINKIVKVNSSIWIGSNSGLYHTFLEKNRLIIVGEYNDLDKDGINKQFEILSFYVDRQENLWIGSRQNGVLKYDPQSASLIHFEYDSKNRNGLSSNRINCFYEDTFGVLWIGTAQGGLNKIDKNQKAFQNYYHNPYDKYSLSSNLITDITEDKDGKIWVSFFDGIICRTEEKLNISVDQKVRFERLEKEFSELSEEWALRLFQDKKGYWWISTNKGLYLYDEASNKLKQVFLEDKGEPVSILFMRVVNQIDADQIILGGSKILILNNPWINIMNEVPIEVGEEVFELGEGNQVNDYVKDSFGKYWFITGKGVFIVVNENNEWSIRNHLTADTSEDGLALSNNRVFAIKISSTGDIWLGTFGGGLMKVVLDRNGNPQKIKDYHRKDGLRDEAIYGILEDDEGQLWISTDMGISCFNPLNETFRFYDVNDGILSNNFRQSAFLKTSKGDILMGGVDGLTIFDPQQILNNKIAPQILISKLKINNQPVFSGKKFNNNVILENSITNTDKITVDYSNRNISLDIIVQHSATPKKNKIAYKLEGINKDWIEIDGGETTATYTNLGSGTYKFSYKGSNGDHLWTDKTETFIIQVLAPWYAKWWSIALGIITALLVAYGIFRYMVRVEKLNQKLKFEQLDKERVYEMNQAKLRFFTNVSHDFKTPLSLIIGPLEKIAEVNNDLKNQKYFLIIKNNIARLQRLIDQLISYRKSESGHLQLNYTKTTLGNFIYPIIEEFEDYAQRVLLNFYYKVDDPNKIISIDLDTTERILLNLFSNAVKYSDSNREISIEAGFINQNDEESLFIKVTNVGIGIPEDKLDKVFNRFYRGVENKGDWQGTGIGLALCKSLIDLMKGCITVTSDPGKKTTFKIILPIKEEGTSLAETGLEKQKKISTDWLPSELDIIPDQSQDISRPTILIVDDEQDIRSFLQEAFITSYNVVLAVNGQDALKKMSESIPQLVISDVMMPILNGYQLCEKIKHSPEYCHIPVILLTADDDNVKKIEGLELGADDYIIKPFSIKYLEVRVKKLIENKNRVFEYYSSNSFMPQDSLVNSIRDKEFLEKINNSIERNMSNSTFGVEELALDIHMSTSHFYRRLKELTGQAPNLYLRNFRLQRAAELLRADKNLTAAEVMYEIGFESKSYYSSSFKKIHGLSPSEFIKKG